MEKCGEFEDELLSQQFTNGYGIAHFKRRLVANCVIWSEKVFPLVNKRKKKKKKKSVSKMPVRVCKKAALKEYAT